MALAREARAAKPKVGSTKPRLSPPVPARHDEAGFRATAEAMGITLMPWQGYTSRFLTATGRDGLRLYRECAVIVARQQGKTTLMQPYIVGGLRQGKRIMHIAQNRELPRIMFGIIADALSNEPDLFPKRRGRTVWPRYGSGQEEITLENGGVYRIAAAKRGGARGHPNDIVIIDELREMESDEVIAAAEPTLTMSPDPQMVYLSNAGDEDSVVLNAVRARRDEDPTLAYLEWSAAPELAASDRAGWYQANPALGHYPQVLRTLEASYNRHLLSGTMATFETEHLCRWVKTMRERLVDDYAWANCAADALAREARPSLAVSMAPDGSRASVALAWRQADGTVDLELLYDVTGHPIHVPTFSEEVVRVARKRSVRAIGFDPLTDAALARAFTKPKPEPISGGKFANATAQFVNIVNAGKLRWKDAAAVTEDLTWTARKHDPESGSYEAVRASDDHPITASLAAIRAVWLASGNVAPKPKVL